jgi:hypothetical protein
MPSPRTPTKRQCFLPLLYAPVLLQPIALALRASLSPLPSLTGFTEPSPPTSPLQPSRMTFSLDDFSSFVYFPSFVFVLMLTAEFPLVKRVEFRWRDQEGEGRAVMYVK